MTAPIALEAISKWYGEVLGVNGITAQLGPGVTGLLGPNGAGKSTLLKLMAGLLQPSRGSVAIFGMNPREDIEVFGRLGFCHDGDGFYESTTGRAYLRFLLKIHGFSARQARRLADEALEIMGLTEQAHKRIGAYSKGMRQRLKMAQAIAHGPEIILLDEPLAGMDPVGRHSTLELVRRWGAAGRVVIISSHILHEIDDLTTNIMMLSQGRLLAEGNIHEVRDLISDRPHQIYIECPNPRALAARLIEFEPVQQIHFERDRSGIMLETFKPDSVYQHLTKIVVDEGIDIHLMISPDDNVQAVFDYLTGGRTEETA
jgi:ABC-2 type transport system ATP-binding protein